MGKIVDVSAMISVSWVKKLAQIFLTLIVKNRAENPIMKLNERPTMAESFALVGCFAPSSFPTLVETLKLRDDGKMYISAVVWIKIPIDATVARGFCNNPHSKIMISYHHHSRHTEMQLGMASLVRDFQPFKHSDEIAHHVFV